LHNTNATLRFLFIVSALNRSALFRAGGGNGGNISFFKNYSIIFLNAATSAEISNNRAHWIPAPAWRKKTGFRFPAFATPAHGIARANNMGLRAPPEA
jgi:hypothetical protein